MNPDKGSKSSEQERKSPFKDDGDMEAVSTGNGEEATSVEEESEAEQQRKEALTERD